MKAHVAAGEQAQRPAPVSGRARGDHLRMEPPSESVTNFSHGFTLLRELNLQRRMGQFCDCVLQLRIHPGRLFLAHKSVLAAFSPVLASLLPRHGALVDLNFPCLTPETLDILLNYIYTGALPPRSQEEAVLSAAFHLQMEQLQQVLRWRRKALPEMTHTVQDKLNQKRTFVERQSLDGTPLAPPSYYPYGSDPPESSSPSCEVVPVICHVKTAGHNKFQLQTHCQDRSSTFEHTGNVSDADKQAHRGCPQTAHGVDNTSLLDQFFEPAQSKQDKLLVVLSESSLNELPCVVAEKVGSQFSNSSDSREFQSTLPENASQTPAVLRTISKDLPSETECSQTSSHSCPQFSRCDSNGDSRCVSEMDGIQSFNPFDSGKGEHLAEILSDTFNDNSYSTNGHILKDRPHLCGQSAAETCLESQTPLCLQNSSSTGMTRERRTSDSDIWPLGILTAEKVAIGEQPQKTSHAESEELSKMRKDYVIAYQGQLYNQCLLERRHSKADSSDSDSDRAFPVSSVEDKDSATVLETIDITEISLSASRPSKSPGERSLTHPFQCSMCERAFSQRGSLNRHMRSHLGVRPYSCPRCSMTFSRQYRVTEHMRVHQRSCEGPTEGHLRTAAAGVDV
ncbi:zinc finger E-box-binding homeobox protein zag-1-like [Colossoma macropomum]|uniref:zinc finger E-box-binding homeobox protein zag-1-like n=1 Tax=Colossoma macropomum TaxID=42526 RepID=UPI001863A9AD|nr:zinc finger E-box-binding homeobox protein zag-1-like [Colossoma macropomum]